MKYNHQRMIIDLLESKPILFNPDLAKVLGTVNAGLFLSQLLYWRGKGKDPEWVYKTVKEFEEETTLTKYQQLSAQKICVDKGVLEVKHRGIPPKRHFKIIEWRLIEVIKDLQIERANKTPNV